MPKNDKKLNLLLKKVMKNATGSDNSLNCGVIVILNQFQRLLKNDFSVKILFIELQVFFKRE